MAGALKHMERSHRSHHTNFSAFNHFHQHAYKVRTMKSQREEAKTLGQRMAGVFAPLRQAMRKATEK